LITTRYSHLISKFEILETKNIFSNNQFYNNKSNYNFDIKKDDINNYLGLYRTSYEIFLKKPFFGSGIKSFGTQCNKLNINDKELLCLTHPHNIYLEIIINQGIVGLLIFLTFISLLIKKYFFDFYLKKNIKEHMFNIFFLTILIAELIPIRSYGSIFQTVNGSLFWFLLALASVKSYIKKN
jgi:O-antigen ligase